MDTTGGRMANLEIDLTPAELAAWKAAHQSVAERLRERDECAAQGNWVVAGGGSEPVMTTRTGHRVQYMWQPSTGRHAYLDLGTDMIIDDRDWPAYGLGAC